LLAAIGCTEEAAPWLRLGVEGGLTVLGEGSEVVTGRIANYSIYLLDSGRYAEAEPLLRQALDTAELRFGDRRSTVLCLNSLGRLLTETKRYDEARQMLERALADAPIAFGDVHPNVAIIQSNMARLLLAVDRPEQAEALLKRAVEAVEKGGHTKEPRIHRVFWRLPNFVRGRARPRTRSAI